MERRKDGTPRYVVATELAILRALDERPGMTVGEVAEEVVVDQLAVSRFVERFKAQGVVKEEGSGLRNGGGPPRAGRCDVGER